MADHTRTLSLTDDQELDWQHVLAKTNKDARPLDQQLADVDALIDLRLEELTAGAAVSRRSEFVARLLPALKEATEADLVAVAEAVKIPREKPMDEIRTDEIVAGAEPVRGR